MDHRPDPTIPEARTFRHFCRGQVLHLIALAVLWIVAEALAAPALDRTDRFWFRLGLGVTVLHQLVVWLAFRAQLGWGLLHRWWGDRAMGVWSLIFLPLLIARPVLTLICGLSDLGSLQMPDTLALVLGVILLVPAAYTLWSVRRWFGIDRAMGADHFEPRYRAMPLVRRGAFRWSENAMYTFGFLALWSIALFTRSHVALVLALFQHAAIWAHYRGTEQPDMDLIYGRR